MTAVIYMIGFPNSFEKKVSQLTLDIVERAFLYPADLSLADTDLRGDLGLRFAAQITKGEDTPLAGA